MIFAITDGKRNPNASFSFEHSWKQKVPKNKVRKTKTKTSFLKLDLKSRPCAKGRNDILNNKHSSELFLPVEN